MKRCPCGFTIDLQPGEFPFHCPCGKRYKTEADMPGAAASDKPSKGVERKPRDHRPLLAMLPEPAKLETEAANRGVLIGDVIASMTKAIGVPPCGGCEQRRQWLNAAHSWARDWLAGSGGKVKT